MVLNSSLSMTTTTKTEQEETIVAIATAHGIGSVAIVRISGISAYDIVAKMAKREFTPRVATLCDVYDTNDNLLDESVVIFFKAPNSFTGEDIVEIQCHGGSIIAQTILKSTIKHGARLAYGGEFSKRAFLNNKMDLSKAEAIAGLIEAKSQDATKILLAQMKGSLREFVEKLRDQLIYMLAYSEVSIDYAEEDLPTNILLQIESQLKEIQINLGKIIIASRAREGLMQGFKIAIIGKPNVGKSSLLNAMLNYDRAIVSDMAGTTRDTIEEQIRIGTHIIRITDTAGIREANDAIEKIGIERSIDAIKQSDIVLALFDSSREFDGEDAEIIELIKTPSSNKKVLFVKNKIDLPSRFTDKEILFDIELNTKNGVEPLMEKLETIMNSFASQEEITLVSQRQISAVEETMNQIKAAFEPLADQELEIFSLHINLAIKEISSISRPFENDEMLDQMFGTFCLGK